MLALLASSSCCISHIAPIDICPLIQWFMLGALLGMSIDELRYDSNSDLFRQFRDLRWAHVLGYAGSCGLLYELGRDDM